MAQAAPSAQPAWLQPAERARVQLIQQRSLELLVAFDDFCRQHRITWFIAGGTLLGAVRHRGFIPWDDDVDVMMTRENYTRFVQAVTTSPIPGCHWESLETNPRTPNMHGKLCSSRDDIVATEHPFLAVNHSLGIDVFPLDGSPASPLSRLRHRCVNYFHLHLILLLLHSASPRFATLKKVIRTISGWFFDAQSSRRRYLENALQYSDRDSESLVCLCGLYGYNRERFPRAWFTQAVPLEFCGQHFPAPLGYHDYLVGHYSANYMQVPASPSYTIHYRLNQTCDDKYDFSLVLCTCGRHKDLEIFLSHLQAATKNFTSQLIVIDQNHDGSLNAMMNGYKGSADLLWIKTEIRSASAARNLGLRHAQGRIVAFPDDDCYYTADTLERVMALFHQHPNADVVLGQWCPPGGEFPAGTPCPLTPRSAFHKGETYVQFFRRAMTLAVGEFDTRFGPGHTPFPGGGEDTDYLLRALQAGAVAMRDPGIHVHHPAPTLLKRDATKVHQYGIARMQLLKKHRCSLLFQLANLLYPLVALLREGPRAFRYRLQMFRGRLAGFLMRARLDAHPQLAPQPGANAETRGDQPEPTPLP